VILFTLAGLAARHWLGIEAAFPVGIILGFLVANLVPANTSCSLPPRAEDERKTPTHQAP